MTVLKKAALGLLIAILLLSGGFIAWASQTNPIQVEATTALQSDAQVRVTSGDWLVFEPAGSDARAGFIFYPGGKVDYRAYAPYARAIAAQGFVVIIPRMPLNLAVFDAAAADEIVEIFPQITTWAVGGHSLGGSMAANYALQNAGDIRGLVLLASYPASSDNLKDSGISVVSIYGTNDGLATGDQIEESRALLPASTRFLAIQGGNHAQFGAYGLQSGDGPAEISQAEQQAQAVAATVELLRSLSSEVGSR